MTYHKFDISQAILRAAGGNPYGVSAKEIIEMIDPAFPKRSMQRHLGRLVEKGELVAIGRARATKYVRAQISSYSDKWVAAEEEVPLTEIEPEVKIPLSATAVTIQTAVQQPIQARKPVSYNRNFLDRYRPNETYYLSESLRSHLMEIGKSTATMERPAGTYARQILNRLLIDLSWNSSRLEGNTYSLLETERLLEIGEVTAGKGSDEAQMILNHKAAIEFMVESAPQLQFNSYIILSLHALLSDNLLKDPKACGALRHVPVGIGKSVYQPLAVPQLIAENFQQILDSANAITDPFEQAFFVMVQLPYLQPFLDVNKRVSRLAANIPFITKNLCPLSFVDVPEALYTSGLLGIYELNRIDLMRDVFVWAYERSSALYSATRQQLGEPDPFRLRFRASIIATVSDIVIQRMNRTSAIAYIKAKAAELIPQEQRARFIEVIEIELMSLHIGNIARYRLKPPEFEAWQKIWIL